MDGRRKEDKPALVSDRIKQAGETRDRWSWIEPDVWTECMLTALDEGVKGGKWFSLLYALANAYFTELGLFSMVTAHAEVCQSSRR